jgi:hypothetical protein
MLEPNPPVTDRYRPSRALLALEDATDPPRSGHKAASLAQLRRQGFEVRAPGSRRHDERNIAIGGR